MAKIKYPTEESSLLHLFKHYRFLILTLGVVVVCLGILISRFSDHSSVEQEYVTIDTTFASWEKTGKKEDFEYLKNMLKKHAELVPKYEGRLVQRLWSLGEYEKAEGWFSDLHERLGHHDLFQTISVPTHERLLGHIEEAILCLEKEQKKHIEEPNSGSLIKQLQLASYYGLLGHSKEKQQVISELKKYEDQPHFAEIFSQGKIKFNDFLEHL